MTLGQPLWTPEKLLALLVDNDVHLRLYGEDKPVKMIAVAREGWVLAKMPSPHGETPEMVPVNVIEELIIREYKQPPDA